MTHLQTIINEENSLSEESNNGAAAAGNSADAVDKSGQTAQIQLNQEEQPTALVRTSQMQDNKLMQARGAENPSTLQSDNLVFRDGSRNDTIEFESNQQIENAIDKQRHKLQIDNSEVRKSRTRQTQHDVGSRENSSEAPSQRRDNLFMSASKVSKFSKIVPMHPSN